MPRPADRAVPARRGSARLLRHALLLAAGLAAAANVPAQSLLELYRAAHDYDATYLGFKALADAAPYRVEQAEALLRPSAGLTGSGARVQTNPTYGAHYGSNSVAVAVTGRQPLFNRPNVATVRQAERSIDATVADLDSAEQDLIVRVSQAYFDVLGAEDTLATTRAAKQAISEQLASAKRNFELGSATITDTREAQARYDLATAQEIAADNDLATQRIALDQLVGRSGVTPKPLAVPAALPELVPDNVEEWVGLAATRHPLVRRAAAAVDIARLETAKARAASLPTVDAVATVSAGHGTVTGYTGSNSGASVGVQLNLPLFAGYAIQSRVKETLLLEDKSQNDLDFARRTVMQSTRQAFYSQRSGAAQVKALEAAEASSELALQATQLGYKVGVRVNIDVLNAQAQLFSTRRDLARARYDVLLGTLRLRQAAGLVRHRGPRRGRPPADEVAAGARTAWLAGSHRCARCFGRRRARRVASGATLTGRAGSHPRQSKPLKEEAHATPSLDAAGRFPDRFRAGDRRHRIRGPRAAGPRGRRAARGAAVGLGRRQSRDRRGAAGPGGGRARVAAGAHPAARRAAWQRRRSFAARSGLFRAHRRPRAGGRGGAATPERGLCAAPFAAALTGNRRSPPAHG